MGKQAPSSPGTSAAAASPVQHHETLPDPAQYATLAEGIQALEQRRIQALLRADVPVLLRLHAPAYQLITPSGTTFTRERYLRLLGDGTLRYLRWDAQAMAVRCGAQMAVVRYRATLQLGGPEGPGTAFDCWHTDSYERVEGGVVEDIEAGPHSPWRAVWSQATQIKA